LLDYSLLYLKLKLWWERQEEFVLKDLIVAKIKMDFDILVELLDFRWCYVLLIVALIIRESKSCYLLFKFKHVMEQGKLLFSIYKNNLDCSNEIWKQNWTTEYHNTSDIDISFSLIIQSRKTKVSKTNCCDRLAR
jgi:hypothetical protein